MAAVNEFKQQEEGNPGIALTGIAVQGALCGVEAYIGSRCKTDGQGKRKFGRAALIASGIGIAISAGSSFGLFSFPEGTLIWTEDGFKPIEQIEVGDLVWSRDENDPDGKNVLNPVTETFNRITSDMTILTLKTSPEGIESNSPLTLVSSNGVNQTHQVRLTPEHPVYVVNRYGEEFGWTMAGNLMPGDEIADIDGGNTVKVVANLLTQTSETVYNFEVEGNHNYFADDLGLWVHNGKLPPEQERRIRKALENIRKDILETEDEMRRNPQNLPKACGQGVNNRFSVQGHHRKLKKLWNDLYRNYTKLDGKK